MTKLKDKYEEILGGDPPADVSEASENLALAIESADEVVLGGDLRVDGKIGFGTAPIEIPTIIDGDLASIQAALLALGIVKL